VLADLHGRGRGQLREKGGRFLLNRGDARANLVFLVVGVAG